MIKGIVILDGPDAAGKTTLAERLIEMNQGNGIILHATYRFKDKIPTYHGVLLRKAIKLSKKTLVIIDRLHISEYIYAKVFRDGTKWPWQLPVFNQICKSLHIPIVICIPSSLEQGMRWFEQTKKERYEMFDDMKEVINEYIQYAKSTKNIMIYNRDLTSKLDFYYEYIFDEIKKEIYR